MITCAEQQIGGIFNAVSPVAHTTIGELLDISCLVTESNAELVWFTPEVIDAAGIAPWTELPIWVPPTGELAGLHDCDVQPQFARVCDVVRFEKPSKTPGTGSNEKAHRHSEMIARFMVSNHNATSQCWPKRETIETKFSLRSSEHRTHGRGHEHSDSCAPATSLGSNRHRELRRGTDRTRLGSPNGPRKPTPFVGPRSDTPTNSRTPNSGRPVMLDIRRAVLASSERSVQPEPGLEQL